MIFADRHDWHLDRLAEALARHGQEPVVCALDDVRVEIGARVPLAIPGCRGRLPAAAMVRGISPGSFEAVTLRLGILKALESMGVTVWNGARAIETCVDKSATSLALVRAGLPTPPTLVTEDRTRALDFVAAEIGAGRKVVLKPLFGSQGKGLRLIAMARDLPDPEAVYGVYYLQRFVPPRGGAHRDFRVFVSAGQVVAAMARRGESWITNIHQGATPEPVVPDAAMAGLAVAAAEAVGVAFAGVDLIEDRDGSPTVLEVNAMPAWRGLQAVAPVPVAEMLVADWLAAAGVRTRIGAP